MVRRLATWSSPGTRLRATSGFYEGRREELDLMVVAGKPVDELYDARRAATSEYSEVHDRQALLNF